MKFDPINWEEIQDGEIFNPQGRLRLQASGDVSVFVALGGREALAFHGTKHEVKLSPAASVRVEIPEGVRCFYHSPEAHSVAPTGEMLTNTDRRPMESGNLLEVTKAIRLFNLRAAEVQREQIRAQRRAQAQRDGVDLDAPGRPSTAPGVPDQPEDQEAPDGASQDDAAATS